jgi:predicted  nucleic acid-binding Zn-ribbon protein
VIKCDNCGEEFTLTRPGHEHKGTALLRYCPFCGSESVSTKAQESAADAARRGVNTLYTDTGRTPPAAGGK